MPPLRYRLLVVLLSPVLVAYTLWKSLRGGGKRYLLQRFGYSYKQPSENRTEPVLWIHAASVGEVITVLPLLKRLDEPVLFTTMSTTGAQVLQQQNLPNVSHVYLPLDFSGACKRFFSHNSIREAWIVETEIWPWLYASAHTVPVTLTIINARLSARTSKQSKGFLASSYAHALAPVKLLTRSEQDAQGFVGLGASAQQISVVGDLKYANPKRSGALEHSEALIEKRYVLAASTHDDEEIQIARLWHQLPDKFTQDALLVVAPRHPERGVGIVKNLAKEGIQATARSQNSPLPESCRIYVADTLGELQTWYAHADACFVGGSLIERGGHNILEPARANCPVVVGPHTFNFQDVVESMLSKNAICEVKNAAEVIRFFQNALNDASTYKSMAERALNHVQSVEQIVDVYLDELRPSIDGYGH